MDSNVRMLFFIKNGKRHGNVIINSLSKIRFTVNYCLSCDYIKYWIEKQYQINTVKETVDVKRCVFKVSKYI